MSQKFFLRYLRYTIYKSISNIVMKAKSKKTDKLSTEERKKLRPSDFGIPEERDFPMPDAAHVRAAEAYFRYASDDKKPGLAHRILLKARKFGVNVESDTVLEWAGKYKK